jgi:hypothetical protein
MRTKLAIAAGGVILAAALGIPDGAQAAVSHSGATRPAATASPDIQLGYCNDIYDMGNHKYLDSRGSDSSVYFDSYENTNYNEIWCANSVDSGHYFEISRAIGGECLAPSRAGVDVAVHEDTDAACGANYQGTVNYTWDDWYVVDLGTANGTTIYAFVNRWDNYCLYDDLQEPPIMVSCANATSDAFEHFLWPQP